MDMPLTRTPTSDAMAHRIVERLNARLKTLPDAAVLRLLEDTVYQERLRFEDDHPNEQEERDIDEAARIALSGERALWESSCRRLVKSYIRRSTTASPSAPTVSAPRCCPARSPGWSPPRIPLGC